MTLIDQFNEFCRESEGKIGAAERGLYMTLLDIWNRMQRPEWFDVSNVQLMNVLKTGSHHSIIKWREALEENGFIETSQTGRTKAPKIKIVILARVKNALVDETRAKNALDGNFSRAKNALVENPLGQKMPYARAKNALVDPKLGQKMPTSQSIRDNREIEISLSRETDIRVTTPPEKPIPQLPAEIKKLYEEYLNPLISGREKEKLAIWCEEYTLEKVKDAILRAADAGGRHINYVGKILQTRKDDANGRLGKSSQRPPRKTSSDWTNVEYKPGWQ